MRRSAQALRGHTSPLHFVPSLRRLRFVHALRRLGVAMRMHPPMEGERPREPFIFASRENIGGISGSAGGFALPDNQRLQTVERTLRVSRIFSRPVKIAV